MFGWLKENRRIGTRYNKLAKTYAAMVTLVCSLRCSGDTFRTKPRRADLPDGIFFNHRAPS
ncbi:ISPs1a-2 [Pseudomonas syringae pv. maculicola]|nr:ISPs1a-2 [Pseudomonas syringae pv. maculicola]